MIHTSNSVEETEQIAAEMARTLRGGECIALFGDLGAGKTQFVRGLIAGLGGDPHAVSSPTFILLHIYETPRLRVFHLDAYRVCGAEDFEEIGFSELFEERGVVIVEWAERVRSILPASRIEVKITSTGETTREIQIEVAPPDALM